MRDALKSLARNGKLALVAGVSACVAQVSLDPALVKSKAGIGRLAATLAIAGWQAYAHTVQPDLLPTPREA